MFIWIIDVHYVMLRTVPELGGDEKGVSPTGSSFRFVFCVCIIW